MSTIFDMSRRRTTFAVAAVVALAITLTGCAANQPGTATPETAQDGGERSSLPPIEGETMDWLATLDLELGNDPAFGAPVISDDRSTVTVHWFGEPSAELESLIDEAPEGLTVEVESTDFSRGELQDVIATIMATPEMIPLVKVAIAHPNTDGSGITLGIVELPAGRELDDIADDFAERVGRPDIPITVEVSGEVVTTN